MYLIILIYIVSTPFTLYIYIYFMIAKHLKIFSLINISFMSLLINVQFSDKSSAITWNLVRNRDPQVPQTYSIRICIFTRLESQGFLCTVRFEKHCFT